MWWEGTSGDLPCNLLLTIDNNRSGQLWLCLGKLKYLMDGDPACDRVSSALWGRFLHRNITEK